MPKNSKKKSKNQDAGKRSYTGKLEIAKSGVGFVVVPGLEKDILIESDNLDTALSGDEVQVEVKGYADNNRRLKGRITQVVRRKQSEFSGRVEVHQHFAFQIGRAHV